MGDLIEVLLREQLITPEQLKDAQDKQKGAKKPIQDILVEMGFLKEEDLMRVCSQVFNTPVVSLDKERMESDCLKLISCEQAKLYGIYPLRKEKNLLGQDVLFIATSDPQDIQTIDNLESMLNMEIQPVFCNHSEISQYIERYYNLDDALYDILKNAACNSKISIIEESRGALKKASAVELTDESSPLVKLVNVILVDAVNLKASDIHIEPRENFVGVRYRIDGDLRNIINVPSKLHQSLVARIKVMASLDITESRKPQDGRISMQVEERVVDLRISIVPTYYGEKVVLRLLDTKEAKTELDKIGLEQEELDIFKDIIQRPQGMVLVTGPTGSGKTSTLYAALNFIKDETKNIVTIEDPVEYVVDGINQIQVNPLVDVTFANALRSILRQDPNVMLVGEIRDNETAEIAFRASLTGHEVFSTLHTNTAVGTITRLYDMGLEPYLIASSVILIVAQRLIRVNCPDCKKEYAPDDSLLMKFQEYISFHGIKKFYKGVGCQKCNFTGYRGRTAIFELLIINENLKSLISHRADEVELLEVARKNGFKLLVESGIKKVAKGITSLDEILRIADFSEQNVPVERHSTGRQKPKIIVADDEDDIRNILAKSFTKDGFDVVQAKDGIETLELIFKEKPDLIILDISMPNMDGFEVVRSLRSKLETSVIPIIMLTAHTDLSSEIRGLQIGADDYITKPCDYGKLLARVNMLLRRSWYHMSDRHKHDKRGA
ncbi:MAG: ATPase, T2SS/T4P/T4SS family [Candidatus Omnitrophota bacterium]